MKKLVLCLFTFAALAACDHSQEADPEAMEQLNEIPEAVDGVIS